MWRRIPNRPGPNTRRRPSASACGRASARGGNDGRFHRVHDVGRRRRLGHCHVTRLANVVKREINACCECHAPRLILSVHRSAQVIAISAGHFMLSSGSFRTIKTVGLSRDQPAAGDNHLTGDAIVPPTIALAAMSASAKSRDDLARALCLESGDTDAPRVNPRLTFGQPWSAMMSQGSTVDDRQDDIEALPIPTVPPVGTSVKAERGPPAAAPSRHRAGIDRIADLADHLPGQRPDQSRHG